MKNAPTAIAMLIILSFLMIATVVPAQTSGQGMVTGILLKDNGDAYNDAKIYDSEENVIIREFNFGTLKNKEMSFPDNCCFKKQLPLNYLDSTNVIFLHKEYTIKQKSSNRQIHFEALHFSDKNVIMDIPRPVPKLAFIFMPP